MNTKVMDLVPYLTAIQEVTTSKLLSSSQRIDVFKEMLYELPPELYCNSSGVTRKLVQSILEDHIDDGKKEEGKGRTQAPEEPKHGKKTKLHDRVGEDGGRQGVKEDVVAKAQKKPRKAKGST